MDLQKESPNPLQQYPTSSENNADMMKNTTPSELFQGCSPQISIQSSAPSESIQGHMHHLSVMSPDTEQQIESEDEIEQLESAEASDNSQTPLSGRTRSARAIQPRKFVIPPAAIPYDSEDMDSDHNSPPVTSAKTKNKYHKRVPRLAAAKRRVSQRGY